jgi:hypothetical protein
MRAALRAGDLAHGDRVAELMPTVVDPQPLVLAVKAAVEAAGVAFGDGAKPVVTGSRPWVVAWFDAGQVDDRSLRSRDGWSMVGTFHCLGLTPESARIAARALRGALLGLHLASVGGRTVQMPENVTSLPLQRNDDVNPPLFDVIDRVADPHHLIGFSRPPNRSGTKYPPYLRTRAPCCGVPTCNERGPTWPMTRPPT